MLLIKKEGKNPKNFRGEGVIDLAMSVRTQGDQTTGLRRVIKQELIELLLGLSSCGGPTDQPTNRQNIPNGFTNPRRYKMRQHIIHARKFLKRSTQNAFRGQSARQVSGSRPRTLGVGDYIACLFAKRERHIWSIVDARNPFEIQILTPKIQEQMK